MRARSVEVDGKSPAGSPHFRGHGSLPMYENNLALRDAAPDDPVVRAYFAVRIDEGKERLWGETGYQIPADRKALASVIDRVLWDWVAAQEPKRHNGTIVLNMLDRQFEYYSHHGIPSDFRMREIGKAPFAAWQTLTDSEAR